MTIEELEHEHFIIPDEAYMASDKHTKLSIEFAIGILKEIAYNENEIETADLIWNKIKELENL